MSNSKVKKEVYEILKDLQDKARNQEDESLCLHEVSEKIIETVSDSAKSRLIDFKEKKSRAYLGF